MRTAVRSIWVPAAILAFVLAGCGHIRPAVTALDDADRAAVAPGASEASHSATKAFAHAEELRQAAHRARESGDDTGAALLAERALVAYQHAMVITRSQVAEARAKEAAVKLAAAEKEQAESVALREALEKETERVEMALADAETRLHSPKIASGTKEREAARLVLAKELVREGRELCAAAALLAVQPGAKRSSLDGGVEAPSPRASALAALESSLSPGPKPVPVAEAASARLSCLRELTHARRSLEADPGRGANDADALLSALGAEGAFTPSRDERGVVVPLEGAFDHAKLTETAETQLKSLAAAAASHPTLAIIVELHVERKDGAKEVASAGGAEAAQVVSFFTKAGVPDTRVRSLVLTRTRAPTEAKVEKAEGAKLFVVFVAADG